VNVLSLREGFNIIRELDIGKIQREAEQPFTLLLVGRPEETSRLAAALEGDDCEANVVELSAPLPVGLEIRQPAAAMVVGRVGALDESLGKARKQLTGASVPAVDLRLAADPYERAEAGALTLPQSPTADDLARVVGPALVAAGADDDSFLLPLARHVPLAREAYVAETIEEVSRVNAWYAFSTGLAQTVPVLGLPLAVADVVVLTKNQIIMAFKIALAAGKPATGRVLAMEVLGVIGGGLLFRQAARELVGLAPGIGIVPKVVIAYAGTRVVGGVVRAWALEDAELDASEMRRLYEEAVQSGKGLARQFQQRAGELRHRDGVGQKAIGELGQADTATTPSGEADQNPG
jgi:uncharacterized protein (DUF697 family)